MTPDIKKIVLFGPESTGKSVLSEQLASHFSTSFVPEYARYYLEYKYSTLGLPYDENQICTEADILPIVAGQMYAEKQCLKEAKKILFCDTNPLQTLVYVKYYYKKTYSWLEKVVTSGSYFHYLLLNTDVLWQDDPLRDRPNNRNEIFNLFEKELLSRHLPYTYITGIHETRLKNCIETIQQLVAYQN